MQGKIKGSTPLHKSELRHKYRESILKSFYLRKIEMIELPESSRPITNGAYNRFQI